MKKNNEGIKLCKIIIPLNYSETFIGEAFKTTKNKKTRKKKCTVLLYLRSKIKPLVLSSRQCPCYCMWNVLPLSPLIVELNSNCPLSTQCCSFPSGCYSPPSRLLYPSVSSIHPCLLPSSLHPSFRSTLHRSEDGGAVSGLQV